MKEKLEIAQYVCKDCGLKYGTQIDGIETYHIDKCDVCGKLRELCHVRRYNYLKKVLDKRKSNS